MSKLDNTVRQERSVDFQYYPTQKSESKLSKQKYTELLIKLREKIPGFNIISFWNHRKFFRVILRDNSRRRQVRMEIIYVPRVWLGGEYRAVYKLVSQYTVSYEMLQHSIHLGVNMFDQVLDEFILGFVERYTEIKQKLEDNGLTI